MNEKSITSLNEILDLLSLFRNDLSDSEYDRARSKLLAKPTMDRSHLIEFDRAVRTAQSHEVIQFFKRLNT